MDHLALEPVQRGGLMGTNNAPRPVAGACLCGAIAFRAILDKAEATACHCSQCRRWSGHHWASINVPAGSLAFDKGEDRVGWYRASDYARRGFCRDCGSALFWHADRLDEHKDRIAIGAGSLAAPTGVELTTHIFVADKGDYYDIADGARQLERY